MAASQPAEQFSLADLSQVAASAPFIAAPQGSDRLAIAQNLTRLGCLDVLVHVLSSSALSFSPFPYYRQAEVILLSFPSQVFLPNMGYLACAAV
jgi:hypothetical protein